MPTPFKEGRSARNPWRVDYIDRGSGRRISRRFPTKRLAQAFIRDLEAGKAARVDAWKITVAEWVVEWLTTHGPEWEPRTITDRGKMSDRFVRPYLGAIKLGDLGRRDVRVWRTQLLAVTTPGQVNKATQLLSAAMSAAVEDEVLYANPCRKLDPLPYEERDRRPAELWEVEAIRAHMVSPHDRLAVSIMAYCGLRPGEVRALRWDDLTSESVTVRRGERVSGRTKTGSVRTVHLIRPVAEDVQEVRLVQAPDDRVLPPVEPANFRHRVWDPARKAAKAESVTPYSLRHTAASLWIAEGRNAFEVARLLGHSTPALTLSTYGHLFDQAQLREGESMEAAVTRARHDATSSRLIG